MANRRLNDNELKRVSRLLDDIRSRLHRLSRGDIALYWAMRRKVYKELAYDERGKPMHRRLLKARQHEAQKGRCAICKKRLPENGAVLDRLEAMAGYTMDNTRLLCRSCDTRTQAERGYA